MVNCDVLITFIIYLHLFMLFMNISSRGSRRILIGVVVVIRNTKLFFNADIS